MDAAINYVYYDYGVEMDPNACYERPGGATASSGEDVDQFVSDGGWSDYEYYFIKEDAGDVYVSAEIVMGWK